MPRKDLTGFDLVWAVTENTVNAQLNWLMEGGLIPRAIRMGDLNTDGIAIGGDEGTDDECILALPTPAAPLLDFDTGQAKLGHLFLTVEKGTATTWTGFGASARQVKYDIAGSRLAFNVNLNIGQIAHEDLSKPGGRIPPEIGKILQHFDSSMFSIQSIFLDFQNSDLDTFNENVSVIRLAQGGVSADEHDPSVSFLRQNFAKMMGSWISKFRGADNPFILGYPVTRNQPSAEVKTILQPTGANLSVKAYDYGSAADDHTKDGLSTLNFLLVTGGKDITKDQALYGPAAGVFSRNLVESNEIDGKGVIASEIFRGTYLEPNLFVPLLAKIKELGDYRHARDDVRPTIAVDELTNGFEPCPATNPTGWHYHDHVVLKWRDDSWGTNYHERESEQQLTFDVFMDMKPHFDSTVDADPDFDQSLLASPRLWLTIVGTMYRREWDQTMQKEAGDIPDLYLGKGWATASNTFKIYLAFVAGADGKITVSHFARANPAVTDSASEGIFKIKDFFNDTFGGTSYADSWKSNATDLMSQESGIAKKVIDDTTDVLQNFGALIVLPAPSQFFYKNILINADGDIEVDVTYKSQG